MTTKTIKPFAKVFAPSEKGWAVVIGDQWTYYQSLTEAITAAESHNANRGIA